MVSDSTLTSVVSLCTTKIPSTPSRKKYM
jgi:uncharacterized membrane protein